MKRLVYGIGINDLTTKTDIIYQVWSHILQRCYDKEYHIKHITYKDCEIDIKWQKLSSFKKWYNTYYIQDYHLDKDLFIPNNKVYGPNTCLFIPKDLNNLLTNKGGKGYQKINNRYYAGIRKNGKQISLGGYSTAKEAHQVYVKAKANHLMDIAENWHNINDRIVTGLYRHASMLENGFYDF